MSTGTPVPDSIQGSVGGQKENIWQAWAASNAKGSKHSANYTWASTVGHSSKADDSGNLAGHDFNSKGKEKESTFPAYDISGRGHSRMLSESTITTTPAYSATSERSVQIDNTVMHYPSMMFTDTDVDDMAAYKVSQAVKNSCAGENGEQVRLREQEVHPGRNRRRG